MMGYRVSRSLEIRGNSEIKPSPSPLPLPLIGARRVDNVRLTPPESYPEQRLSRVNCAWAQPVLAHPPPYGVIATGCNWTDKPGANRDSVRGTHEMLRRGRGSIKYSILGLEKNGISFVVSFFFGCYNIRSSESVETTRLKLNYCGYGY